MDLTDHDVRAILQLLDASVFDELDLETDAFKLTLRRAHGGGWTREDRALKRPRVLEVPPAAATPHAAAPGAGAGAGAGTLEVRSPLPGTFYRAPKPGAAPFVEVGVRVGPQTVVAIVETMKLMNSIHAGAAGCIAEICAVDGEMVAQHALLLRIQPDPP